MYEIQNNGVAFNRAIFLDRDGVINKDVNNLYKKEAIEIF